MLIQLKLSGSLIIDLASSLYLSLPLLLTRLSGDRSSQGWHDDLCSRPSSIHARQTIAIAMHIISPPSHVQLYLSLNAYFVEFCERPIRIYIYIYLSTCSRIEDVLGWSK